MTDSLRSNDALTASDLNGVPSWNLTPSRSLSVKTLLSGDAVYSVASKGTSSARNVAYVLDVADAPRIRLVGNVVATPDAALDSVDPGRLRIGAKVQVAYTRLPDGTTVPRWLLERP